MIRARSGRITTQALISMPAADEAPCASASGTWKPTVSPPPMAADCLRNFLRDANCVLVVMAAPLGFRFCRLHGACRGVDRGADPRVGAAAADVGHRLVDVLVARAGIFLEERDRCQDLPALAIAALRNLVVVPGLLHRVQAAAGREAFDG